MSGKAAQRSAHGFQTTVSRKPAIATSRSSARARRISGTGTVAGDGSLSFDRETDRIYYEVPGPLILRARALDLEVAMAGFRDTVVWNPWAERCAALPDMPADGYRRMLCIEAAVIDKPVTLAGGGSWSGRQLLTVL